MRGSTINLINTYYRLAKPERTVTNTLTAVAGFLFATQWHFGWTVFLYLIAGLTLVLASAGVFNNYIDRKLDSRMERTKDRPLASGRVSTILSLLYGGLLGIGGFYLLTYTNWLTVGVVAVGFFSYLVVYGWAKRHTIYSTLIGTVPGGASIIAGYTAATNRLDAAALILFLIMLSWQMVHFYAIGIYRLRDYKAAKIPVLPVKKSIRETKKYMLAYVAIFIFAATLLTWEGYAGYIYLASVLLLGLVWLNKVMAGFSMRDNNRWAKDVFKYSLVVLLLISALIAVGPVLP